MIYENNNCKGANLRILGLDYGDRRIGVALCDELEIAAHGLTTIVRRNRETDMTVISGLIERFNVDMIVIGYPTRMDGSEGIQCEKVNRFVRRLESRFHLPVMRWNETLSTKEAEDIMRADTPGKRKQKKIEIDRVAASIILQRYLDSLSGNRGCAHGQLSD
jgi:putative Holliday junction resolvase